MGVLFLQLSCSTKGYLLGKTLIARLTSGGEVQREISATANTSTLREASAACNGTRISPNGRRKDVTNAIVRKKRRERTYRGRRAVYREKMLRGSSPSGAALVGAALCVTSLFALLFVATYDEEPVMLSHLCFFSCCFHIGSPFPFLTKRR